MILEPLNEAAENEEFEKAKRKLKKYLLVPTFFLLGLTFLMLSHIASLNFYFIVGEMFMVLGSVSFVLFGVVAFDKNI
jgi:hypothetical protein